jgi:hypothetical protein
MDHEIALEERKCFGRVILLIRLKTDVDGNKKKNEGALESIAQEKRQPGSREEEIEKRRRQSGPERLPEG